MKFSKIKDRKNISRLAVLFLLFSTVVFYIFLFALPVFAAQGAHFGKSGSVSAVYGSISVLSLMLVAGYLLLIKKKNIWVLMLFLCVFVVNSGYYALSVAKTMAGALFANRISDFAVFLPLIMLVIIMDVCQIKYGRLFLAVLIGISSAAFLLAVSGGFFGMYYRDIHIELMNGATKLYKVYGPLHFLYSVYLFVYFGMMVASLLYSIFHKKVANHKHAVIHIAIVLGNIGVWFMEHAVEVDFELLSVTYPITEIFLLLLYYMMQDYDILASSSAQEDLESDEAGSSYGESYALPPDVAELFDVFSQRAVDLTPTERKILKYYAERREVSEVAELAFISIHTVRKHNANIYQKLAVGSRDELMLYLELFRRCGRLEELL